MSQRRGKRVAHPDVPFITRFGEESRKMDLFFYVFFLVLNFGSELHTGIKLLSTFEKAELPQNDCMYYP